MVRSISQLIDDICEHSSPGDEIIWEQRQKELRWRWLNSRTEQEWFLRLTEIKRMPWLRDQNDPRNAVELEFVYGKKTPFEARRTIDKLEKLKAFW